MSKSYSIYLDVCCLNRPFDDQKQDRIRLETEAIIIILKIGFSAYDAAHIASAEEAKVDILLTTDDRLLKRSLRYADILKVQLANPLYWLENITREGD